MGGILSRFKKKKETTFQILECLDNRIKKIEDFSRDTEQRQRIVVGQLILYSVGLYILAAIFFYFYYFPTNLRGQVFCVTPLLIFPILVVLLKRLVQWHYHRKITRNQELLSELKDEKRVMLENVKDNETYKVAKQILEKFAPDQLRRPMPAPSRPAPPGPLQPGGLATPIKPAQSMALAITPGTELRHRPLAPPPDAMMRPPPDAMMRPPPTPAMMVMRGSPGPQFSPQRRPPMARPIIPSDRSFLDKVVEYLVGDGPSNRYALICAHCHSHNGMALKEEFEYLAFQCCFCMTHNPARKQRPSAPRLPSSTTRGLEAPPPMSASDVDSTSDSTEESDADHSSEPGAEGVDSLPEEGASEGKQERSSEEPTADDKICEPVNS